MFDFQDNVNRVPNARRIQAPSRRDTRLRPIRSLARIVKGVDSGDPASEATSTEKQEKLDCGGRGPLLFFVPPIRVSDAAIELFIVANLRSTWVVVGRRRGRRH